MDIVNPLHVSNLITKDMVFENLYTKYGLPTNYERPQSFKTLCKIILEQQVSLASAKAHYEKLEKYVGEVKPENIINLTELELKNCYVSRQKATYLKDLSQHFLDNTLNLNELVSLSNEDVIKKLTQVKGIGLWTAQVYLMFCLQRKEIFPIGDVAIRTTIIELYGKMDKEAMLALSETWKPYQSLATFFLWHYYLIKRNKPVIF